MCFPTQAVQDKLKAAYITFNRKSLPQPKPPETYRPRNLITKLYMILWTETVIALIKKAIE